MSKVRTSETHPLQIAAVQADHSHGRIGITFCPGKYDLNATTGAWHRDLDADLDAIRAWGANLVVTLVEQKELSSRSKTNSHAADTSDFKTSGA